MNIGVKKTEATVAVVVTAHNYGQYLQKCLDSIIHQECAPDFKLVVVDDGSSDHTVQVLEPYEKHANITKIRLSGLGLAKAANIGIKCIDSEWIIRVDADDWIHPRCLQILMDAANCSGADLVYADYYLVDDKGHPIKRKCRCDKLIGAANEQSPLAAGCLFKRSCWEVLGGYNESLDYQEDFDFWLKFVELFPVHHVSRALMYYRRHRCSMSQNLLPRAEARRKVKRDAIGRRGKSYGDKKVPVLISTLAPIELIQDPNWALVSVNGKTLIGLLRDKLRRYRFLKPVGVIAGTEEIGYWAGTNGWPVIKVKSPFIADQDMFESSLEFIGSSLSLIATPFFPLVDHKRVPEVIETLLLHDCGRVDTVVKNGLQTLVYGNRGLSSLEQRLKPDSVGDLIFRQSGGLTAVKKGVETGSALRGYVELVPPEDYIPTSEAGLRWVEFSINDMIESEKQNRLAVL